MNRQLPTIKSYNPTEKQMSFLSEWLAAREADTLLAEVDIEESPELNSSAPLSEDIARQFHPDIEEGQIRLLTYQSGVATQRPVYVAVLRNWEPDTWLVAPYSSYHVPVLPGELLVSESSNIDLRVLCLWNARTVPQDFLLNSWLENTLTDIQKEEAWSAFRHVTIGSELPGDLQYRTGPKIIRPDDPRIAYQQEEVFLLNAMTSSHHQNVASHEEKSDPTIIIFPEIRKETGLALAAAEKDTSPVSRLCYQIEDTTLELEATKYEESDKISLVIYKDDGTPSRELDGAVIVTSEYTSSPFSGGQLAIAEAELSKGVHLRTSDGTFLPLKLIPEDA